MPQSKNLVSLEVDFSGGYHPSTPNLSPEEFQRTIKAGGNVFLRSGGKLKVANGLLQTSATNVGARIFAADIERATIAGGLEGDRLPFAGLVRYQNAVLYYLSEDTSAQVYLDETAVTGLTTSSTAGRLRVAVPDGAGGYNVFDAGFEAPVIPAGDIVAFPATSGASDMKGRTGAAISPWRVASNSYGPPSNIVYNDIEAGANNLLQIDFPSAVSGQTGWLVLGTRWGDESGVLRVVRKLRINPRGTAAISTLSPDVTGTGTRFLTDLRIGDSLSFSGGGGGFVESIASDTAATLTADAGATGSGKTITISTVEAFWYDGDLGELINRDVARPPKAAGLLSYAGRVLLWGIPDTDGFDSASVTGNVLVPMLDNNPEHVDPTRAISTASGSDLVNVLGGDGPLYLMTTTSLEVVSFTGDPSVPYIIRIVAEPGFKATSNGCLYKDWFYGFNNRPLRTRARENIDVEFAEPVWSDMEDWDAQRVIVAVDPKNEAVLYIFDDGAATEVIPWMTQLSRWSPPLNFSARIIDAAVVNGTLYVTYLSGGNYRVNEWEGGTGIGGTMFSASQYYDPDFLNRNRLKRLAVTGKIDSLSVYSARQGAAVPDVSNLAAATQTFTLTDTDITEPEIHTNIEGRAHAFRVDFSDGAGTFDKLVVRGIPKTEQR